MQLSADGTLENLDRVSTIDVLLEHLGTRWMKPQYWQNPPMTSHGQAQLPYSDP